MWEWCLSSTSSLCLHSHCNGSWTHVYKWLASAPRPPFLKSCRQNDLLILSSSFQQFFYISFCDSCSINKSHRLPFHKHGLTSSAPFDLIHTDVWGPLPEISIHGHKYYVIFIDHFTKYIWFFSLRNKSDVKVIFLNFIKWSKIGLMLISKVSTLIMVENLLLYNLFLLSTT